MTLCACGKPLHYRNPAAQTTVTHIVYLLGPEIKVHYLHRAWMVPRHFIALHGLKAKDLPALAEKYGFTEVTQ